MTLLNVACVLGLCFKLFSLFTRQAKEAIVVSQFGVPYTSWGGSIFPRCRFGFNLSATRVAPANVVGYPPISAPPDGHSCDCPRQDVDNPRGARHKR